MEVKQPLCYRFIGFWALCSAAMTAIFLFSGGKNLWVKTIVILMGAILGSCSALIAWKTCKKLKWGIISCIMILSALLISLFEWLLVAAITCSIGLDLHFWVLVSYYYFYSLFLLYPWLLPYTILIFIINYFLIKKLTRDEEEKKELEEVWNKIAGQE